ncbi:hypothetical protein HUJ04_008557 [Dendroctonus ponderosae]|nr:hypothetical protein HUJ04_008557 [Dendroctonus ponderosae]
MYHSRFFFCTCSRRYLCGGSLRRHQKYECGKEPVFQCQFCPYKSKHKFDMRKHVKNCHNTVLGQALTSVKEEVDAAKSDLAAVVKVENVLLNETVDNSAEAKSGLNKKEIGFVYCSCQQGFKSEASLMRHQELECDKEQTFQCQFCKTDFQQRAEMSKHIKKWHNRFFIRNKEVQSANQGPKRRNAHRIKGSFSCDKCERKYIRKDSLQRHQTYECGKEPQFSCPFCGQRFKRRSHQLRHISRSHPDKIAILKENNPTLKIETLRF